MDRVNDILEYLVRLLTEKRNVDEQTVIRELLEDGYDFKEIESAFASLSELFTFDEEGDDPFMCQRATRTLDPGGSYLPRILSTEECSVFDAKAHGVLVRLQAKGLLSAEEVDQIVTTCQRAQLEAVGLDELNLVIEHVCEGGGDVLDMDGPERGRFVN